MKRMGLFICYELKYLFRQRVLQFLVVAICLFTIYGAPTEMYPEDWDNSFYEKYEEDQSYEGMTDREITAIESGKMKIEEIQNKRKSIYEMAVSQKQSLNESESFQWEYLTGAEEIYGKEIFLRIGDYKGWESYFASKAMMLGHSKMALFTLVILVSSGLFLLSKDGTNRTLFWSAYTGRGVTWSSYTIKLLAIFIYGFCVQLVQSMVQMLSLIFISKCDMSYWLESIQNLSVFGTCCFYLNIVGLILLHMFLLNVAALFGILFTVLFIRILKKELLLFVGGIGVTGILYIHVYACDKSRIFDFFWRMNPLSVMQMDQFLQYDVWNIGGHAVLAQLGTAGIWAALLTALYVGAYHTWRRYLNEARI